MICASQNGYEDIVQLLLSQPGIDINHKNIRILKSIMIFKGISILLYFTNARFMEFLNLTINITAIETARMCKHQQIVDMLSHASQN